MKRIPATVPKSSMRCSSPGKLNRALAASVDTDPYLQFYRSQAIQEDIQIGWDMVEDEVDAPAYDGLLDLSYAEPLDPTV